MRVAASGRLLMLRALAALAGANPYAGVTSPPRRLELRCARPAVALADLHTCPLSIEARSPARDASTPSDRSSGVERRVARESKKGKDSPVVTKLPMQEYPLSLADLDRALKLTAASGENWRRLTSAVLRARGEPIRVGVLGGSMTLGTGCSDPCGREALACAWPARLQAFFSRFYDRGAGAMVVNLAGHGKSSATYAGLGLGNASAYAFDVVLLDCSINDGAHLGDGTGLPVALETLVRMVWALPSSPAIVAITAYSDRSGKDYGVQAKYLPVCRHYGVPIVSFHDAATTASGQFRPEIADGFGHPPWRVHQLFADVVAHFWRKADAEAPCSIAKEERDGGGAVPEPLASVDSLGAASLCAVVLNPFNEGHAINLRPVLSHLDPFETASTRGSVHGTNVQIEERDGWACFDDRADKRHGDDKGRPGWISTSSGSVFRVKFQASDGGAVGLSFLQSFNNISAVSVKIDGRIQYEVLAVSAGHRKTKNVPVPNRTIDARWSKSYSLPGLWMLRRLTGGWHTIELTLLPFQQDRRASDALLSQRLPGKFKVLELTSC